jgi:hypothetical protein
MIENGQDKWCHKRGRFSTCLYLKTEIFQMTCNVLLGSLLQVTPHSFRRHSNSKQLRISNGFKHRDILGSISMHAIVLFVSVLLDRKLSNKTFPSLGFFRKKTKLDTSSREYRNMRVTKYRFSIK